MQTELETVCARAMPTAARLRASPPAFLAAGWESDIYTFDLAYDVDGLPNRETLALRLYSGAGAARKAAHEFRVLQRLHAAGYPVPRPVACAGEGEASEPFVVMEYVAGPTMWQAMDAASDAERSHLIAQFCGLAVRLHQLDASGLTPTDSRLGREPYAAVDAMLAAGRDMLARFPGVGLSPIVAWLAARRDDVPCPRPAVLHWDYHPGNVLVRPDGSPVVIDWTGSQVSDARFDLGWTLLLAQAYGGQAIRDQILAGYERLSGATVQALEFFEVFACARRLLDVGVSLAEGAQAMGMREATAARMREDSAAIERVYDLLRQRSGLSVPAVERLLRSLA
jgi:aminoglycoside phosphotransferase (APT) family kinase protein